MALRKVIFGLVGAAALAVAGMLAWRAAGPIDVDALSERYRLPASQFAEIDGIRVHYAVEGAQGAPCLVLIHGAFMNLRVWDGLVAELGSRFRIVRMDLLAAGLTGLDPAENDPLARDVRVVNSLTRKLGADTCTFVGTSTGAIVAFREAAAQPDRVARLVLIDAGGLPGVADRHPPSRGWLGQWVHDHIRFQSYWTDWLYDRFGVYPPSTELPRITFDMNRRRGLRAYQRRMRERDETATTQATLAKITAPTLLLWGTADPVTPHMEAEAFALWLTQAPSLIKKYPHMGHFPYLEIPDAVAKDIAGFADGAMDVQLARTVREPSFPRNDNLTRAP